MAIDKELITQLREAAQLIDNVLLAMEMDDEFDGRDEYATLENALEDVREAIWSLKEI